MSLLSADRLLLWVFLCVFFFNVSVMNRYIHVIQTWCLEYEIFPTQIRYIFTSACGFGEYESNFRGKNLIFQAPGLNNVLCLTSSSYVKGEVGYTSCDSSKGETSGDYGLRYSPSRSSAQFSLISPTPGFFSSTCRVWSYRAVIYPVCDVFSRITCFISTI